MKSIHLNRREKFMLSGAACFLAVFFLFHVLISPLLGKKDRLLRSIGANTSNLTEIQSLQAEYRSLQATADLTKAALAKRDKDFSLFSFLDTLNGEIDIRKNVSYMKPSRSLQKETNLKVATVELKLLAVTLTQLSRYLYNVEYSDKNLFVRRMTISETETLSGYIDVQLQVETVEL